MVDSSYLDPHTVRGRSTQKDSVCNENIFRNGLLCEELKIARKESNDLADLAKVVQNHTRNQMSSQ